MIPAPLKEGLFNTIGSVIKSQSWAQWFSKLVSKPALDPPGNSTLFLRGDDTWEVPGGFVPGAHANSHVANGSDPLVNLSQSQITDLTTDLAGKAETTTTITGSGLLTGEGGSLAANRTFDLVNSDIDHNQLTNYQANQHFLETSINHLNINNIGTNTHAQVDDHIANGSIHFTEGSIDHGSISGLSDDDHTQYLLADGSRDLTSSWEVTQEIIVSNKLSGKRDDIPTGVIDSALYGEYHADLPANTVQCAIFGYMKNTGTTPPVFGHGIGVLGLAEDVANSEQDIYGFEGRVNGISLHSGINYYGALGLCTFQNANFNGAVYGVQSRREITTDGSTPLAEGISVGFYAPAGIGGAINYSFWGQDQLRLDNNLVIFDTTAANYGIISKSAGGDLYITSDNGNVNLNTDDLITTGQVTSSELLVDTNTLAVNLPSYTDKVGINTVTPASSLDVVGDTRLGDSATNYTEVESDGDVVFNGGAGLCYGEIYAIDNSTVTTISASATDYQVTVFDTDGPYNNTTPDHTNDHITIDKDGDYLINFSASISVAGGSANFIKVKVMKNNGASLLGSLQLIRIFYGWGGEQDSASLSGIVGLSANDTVEVWARNMTNTDNYTFENISLNVTQVGG